MSPRALSSCSFLGTQTCIHVHSDVIMSLWQKGDFTGEATRTQGFTHPHTHSSYL